ncbi:alpha/beta fold hydrolase [Novosphingobium sp. P6W]|uniref:alpha/beta fold hydrolase n=1 Tax=Novosphingobium sp. P6W TaxID=1609758 RepID=UPI0006982F28|nr:alpha/beta hydrolase [Novosphingobium sp. P6W]AXB79582.1 alpha/beta fold hydrolase [Novosphingobium sp. P6W]
MFSRRDIASAIGLAGAISALPAIAAPTSGAKANTAPMPPKGPWTRQCDLRRAGGVLHYAVIGEPAAGKPPVVLLHKLGGWLSDWRFVAPLLAQGRQVYAFDLPGHGGSHWDGAAPYIQSLGETAALLVGAFDELGFDKVDLIGTSLGGCLAVPLAAFWPERINKLALVSCALGHRRSLAEIKAAVDDKQGALFDKNGDPVPTPPELLTQIFGIVNTGPINAEGILSRKAAGKWIQPSERGVAITEIAGTMNRIAAPTLLVYGQFDKAYPKFRSSAEAALKRGKTAVVENSGAFVMQDNPPATARVLKAFLDEA